MEMHKLLTTADRQYKWDLRYLKLAREIGSWSKDPSSKIGSVIVGDEGRVLSTGYNGFPRGINDYESRLNDREVKYAYVVHAEMNCIYNASSYGVSLRNTTIYVYGLPACSECAKGIIQSGIKRVVYTASRDIPEHWHESAKTTADMFAEAGVDFIYIEKIEVDAN